MPPKTHEVGKVRTSVNGVRASTTSFIVGGTSHVENIEFGFKLAIHRKTMLSMDAVSLFIFYLMNTYRANKFNTISSPSETKNPQTYY